jgi:hypothetical protein
MGHVKVGFQSKEHGTNGSAMSKINLGGWIEIQDQAR